MAVPGMPRLSSRRTGRIAAAGGKGSQDSDGSIVFTFEADPAEAARESTAKVDVHEPARGTSIKAAEADSDGSSGSDPDQEDTLKPRRGRTAAKRSKAEGSTTRAKSASGTTKAKRSSAAKDDPFAGARAAATEEARSHEPAAFLSGREHWLYATVPATPVAGAQCVVYFNRAQSDPLKDRPRMQLHAKFNNWELAPEGTEDRVDMEPAVGVLKGVGGFAVHCCRRPQQNTHFKLYVGRHFCLVSHCSSSIGHALAVGTDFWAAEITIPTEAYEINFIVGDGEGVYDNNATQNYVVPVEGPMTQELWIDTAPERAVRRCPAWNSDLHHSLFFPDRGAHHANAGGCLSGTTGGRACGPGGCCQGA